MVVPSGARQRMQRMWNKRRVLCDLAVFSLCWLFLAFVVEPNLVYHAFGTIVLDAPAFSTGWSFARESFGLPGGCISYVSGFLSQGYAYSWLGALIIVLVAWCLLALSRWHLAHAECPGSDVLAYVPVLLILMVYSRYQHPLAGCLTVSMGLIFSLVFERVPLRGPLIRSGIYGLMAAASYCLMGAGGLGVFAVLTTVYAILVRREWMLGAVVVPAGAAITWVLADQVFHLSPAQAFLVLTPFSPDTMKGMKMVPWVWIVALYAFVPVALLLAASWKGLSRRIGGSRKTRSGTSRRAEPRAGSRPTSGPPSGLRRLALPGLAVAVAACGLTWSHDKMNRQFVLMNALSRQGRWAEVLEAARQLPKGQWNIFCNHDINRALFHSGRLGYEMFSFPQKPDALLLTDQHIESSLALLKLCDAYMEMGNLNASEKLASEFMVTAGRFGPILERLAWIHIIKGEPDTARVYLLALKRDLIYRDTAEAMLDGLRNGFEPDQAAHVERLRQSMRERGLFGSGVEVLQNQLLEHNPRNKMAFEYLMASYLLTGQLDKIVANVERLKPLGYPDIPTHYEEAILLYYGLQGRRVELNRFPIRPETVQRYRRFAQLNNSMGTADPQAVLDLLTREFGTSYFFYYRFQCPHQGR